MSPDFKDFLPSFAQALPAGASGCWKELSDDVFHLLPSQFHCLGLVVPEGKERWAVRKEGASHSPPSEPANAALSHSSVTGTGRCLGICS